MILMLTLPRLVGRNLRYHWRDNLAVLLGVAVGAAVLTGSLLVGDSLRGSLRDRAERQLNGVDAVYVGARLVRDKLADELPGNVAPVFLMQGSIEAPGDNDQAVPKRLGRITLLGVDRRFAPQSVPPDAIEWDGQKQVVAISQRIADRLGLKAGDRIEIGLEQKSNIPRSSLLGHRDEEHVTKTLKARVGAVLAPDDPAADFTLVPGPSAALNVYVPLNVLQNAVDQTGRVNALLARNVNTRELNKEFLHALTLDDLGVTMKLAPKRKDYISVESRQLVLDPAIADAVIHAAGEARVRAEPTVIYLANWITDVDRNAVVAGLDAVIGGFNRQPYRRIPYSVVAGLNTKAIAPLGPFLPPNSPPLADDEIVLAQWRGSPLADAKPGDTIELAYFEPELESGAREVTKGFRLRATIPIAGPADDPDLTPPFPGVTDKPSLEKWDPPFPYDPKRVSKVDEEFWDSYRTTPKAYITQATATRIFGSRFGSITSMRLAPASGATADETIARVQASFRGLINYPRLGLHFSDTRERLRTISKGGTDFGMLFLGFSFFLIAAALMLVGLLFRLSLDRRAKEVGLLLAAGYSPRQVRRLLLGEGLALAVLGAALGVVLGLGFNRGMLALLAWLWPDPSVGTFLRPHATPLSLAVGYCATVLMALFAIYLSCRGLVRVPPPALLRGETTVMKPGGAAKRRLGLWIAGLCLIVGLVSIAAGGAISNPDFRSMSFFGGGALLLTAMLMMLNLWMKRTPRGVVSGRGTAALTRLAARNATRHPRRSLLTASLLAAAAFLLVAVESFRRHPEQDFLDIHGGSGGFNLLGESAVPIFQRFDSGDGLDQLESALQTRLGGSSQDPRFLKARDEIKLIQPTDGVPNVFPLQLRGGDDASCLNLYKADRPRVLGVPRDLIQRGGFKFSQSEAQTPDEKANPWLLLSRTRQDEAIPAVVEQNTAMWMLKTGIGGVVEVPDENGAPLRVRIVGTLVDSPFQSEIIVGDAAFRKMYPHDEGYRVFLIRTPPGQETTIARVLGAGLSSYGFEAEPTREKVAAYQAVIGAYLSAFQVLGGLGLLLGVLGLAVVILRGVWERLAELALFRAFGYRSRHLEILVLVENLLLLLFGLASGVLAALISVAPHLVDGASVPWARLALMLGAVLVVGFVVAFLATAGILRVPLIPALRRE